jgi:hypothetical protein
MFGSTPDQTHAMGLLGARMMAGNTAQGFADAGQYMAGAKDRDMARQLQAMQMQQHQLALQKAQREQAKKGCLACNRSSSAPALRRKAGLLPSMVRCRLNCRSAHNQPSPAPPRSSM